MGFLLGRNERTKKLNMTKQDLTPPHFVKSKDSINHPPHYTQHPSGVECIDITEHMNFCLGNAVKYIWRASLKGNQVEELEKAKWYLTREIERITKDEKTSKQNRNDA